MDKQTIEKWSLFTAIIGLVFTLFLTVRQHNIDTQFHINKEISATSQKIQELRNKSNEGKIPTLRADVSTEYYSLLIYADELIKKAEKPGVADCIIIAREMALNYNYHRSLELYKTAAENAPDNTYEKIQALRQLGNIYSVMAQIYSSKKQKYKGLSEESYDQAIDVWDESEAQPHKSTTNITKQYKREAIAKIAK